MKIETIKIDDILRVYSNVALVNAKFIANINNKDNKNIKEYNFEEHLVLNKKIQNKISKFNKEAQKNDEDVIEEEKFKINLCIYLRNLRNFYSHHLDETSEKQNDHLKAKEWLEKNEENFQKDFKRIFWSTSYFSYFKDFKEFNWRIYIISLFLTSLEFGEMIDSIKKNEIEINKYIFKSPLRNLRFRFNIYRYEEPIEMRLLNYIKTFNEIKNYKKSFANQAINLLNWKYKKQEIKFKKEFNKGQFLFSLNSIKDEINFMFNFSQLRRILFLDDKKFIAKIKEFKSREIIGEYGKNQEENKASDLSLDFKSFQNKFKTEKIDLRHLLKILNKILSKQYNAIIKQKQFEDLFKDLSFKNTNRNDILILESKNEPEIKKIIEILNIKEEENEINMLSKIKDFIYKEIDTKEKFQNIFNKKSKFQNENTPIQNEKLMFLDIEENLRKNIKDKFNYYTSSSLKLKDEKTRNNFRKFLIPLIMFYQENILDKKDSLDIEKILDKDKDYVIEDKLIIEIFKNKILNNKDYKVYFTFDKKKSELFIKSKLIQTSDREIISSKLFSEFCKLLKIEKIEQKEDWKKVIKKLNWYKNQELSLFKKIYDKHNIWTFNKEEKDYRNYIFHRSISKFQNFDKFEEYVNDKTRKKSTPDFSKNR